MITTDLFIYRKEQIMNLAFWSVSLALSALMAGWEAYRVITRDNRRPDRHARLVHAACAHRDRAAPGACRSPRDPARRARRGEGRRGEPRTRRLGRSSVDGFALNRSRSGV